jgi:hypothetical protein
MVVAAGAPAGSFASEMVVESAVFTGMPLYVIIQFITYTD